MDEINRKRFFLIVREMTGLDAENIDPECNFKEQTDIDSMQLFSLAIRIENEFQVELPMSIQEVNSINGVLQILQNELMKKRL